MRWSISLALISILSLSSIHYWSSSSLENTSYSAWAGVDIIIQNDILNIIRCQQLPLRQQSIFCLPSKMHRKCACSKCMLDKLRCELFYYIKLHLNSMKGIHIQFQGINQFIDSTLANISSQAADCYLLNLQKITLETFTILHIALTNAPNQIPEEVLSAFQKTSSKFKEYFKRKPKLDTDKQELYHEDFDEVKHFLDNRPLLGLDNESERGELFKFLSENEEKQKNNKIMLDNRPKYAYGASKINLEELKKPINSVSKPTLKQRSQQTYSSDFVIKPECIFPALQKESQTDEQTQTQLSIGVIRDLIEQYTREIIQDRDQIEMKSEIGDLLVCLQSSASQVLTGAMKKRFGEGEQQDIEKHSFIEELIQGKEMMLQKGDLSLLGFHKQKKQSKKKQKNSKKPAKRGSEIVKVSEEATKSITQGKDLSKHKQGVSTNKNIPASSKSIQSKDTNTKNQGHLNERRTSISNFALGNSKLQKGKASRPSQFVGKAENQTNYPSIQESPEVAYKSGGIAALQQAIDQSCQYNYANNLHKSSTNVNSNSIFKDSYRNQHADEKQQLIEDKQGAILVAKQIQQRAQFDNGEDNSLIGDKNEEAIDSNVNVKQEANQKESKDEDRMKISDLLRLSEEKQLQQQDNWQHLDSGFKITNHPLIAAEIAKQQESTIHQLPAIDKSAKHSFLYKDKNAKSNSQLFYNQQSKEFLTSKFKQTHLSQNYLHANKNQSAFSDIFSPKSMNASFYNPQYAKGQYKLPTVKRDSKALPQIRSQQVNQTQHKAWVQREGQRLLKEIKQNTSTQRQKSIEWFKLVKNIKQYQKHHMSYCGANCVHLSKFYDFLKKQNLSMYMNRKQLSVHKKNIEIDMRVE